jgi:hypothetical protein
MTEGVTIILAVPLVTTAPPDTVARATSVPTWLHWCPVTAIQEEEPALTQGSCGPSLPGFCHDSHDSQGLVPGTLHRTPSCDPMSSSAVTLEEPWPLSLSPEPGLGLPGSAT